MLPKIITFISLLRTLLVLFCVFDILFRIGSASIQFFCEWCGDRFLNSMCQLILHISIMAA